MADVTVAILGLNRVGTSVGLALKRYNTGKDPLHTFTVRGYDPTPDHVTTAKKLGALDETASRPEQVVPGSDIVLLTMPYADVEPTYQLISPDLRSGAVVLDMSPLSHTSLAWAKEHLREGVHLVCMKAVVNPVYFFDGTDEPKRATEDYFDNGAILTMPSVTCVPEAIELASEFSRILGSRSHFVDPAEHDGLAASTEALPALLGTTYFDMIQRNPGWGDLQRLTNPAFGMTTHHLFDTHPDDLRDFLLNSGDTLTHHLDALIERLTQVRAALATRDRDALESLLVEASASYEAFYNRRYNNKWDDEEEVDTRSLGINNVMGTWFGIRRGRGSDKKNDNS